MGVVKIVVLLFCGIFLTIQANAQKALIIGMDHPFSYSLQKSDKSPNCELHKNFYNGACRAIGNQRLVNYLSKQMGMPVKIYNYENKNTLSKQFISGQVDIAFFHVSNFQTTLYSNKQITKPILTTLETNKDTDKLKGYYFSDFIVNTKSQIKDIANLKIKKIGLRCGSTSGNYLPYILLLKKYHLNPLTDLKVIYYPSIKMQAEALQKNQVDAIFIWNRYLENYMIANNITADQFSIIKKYKIPSRVFTANTTKVTPEIQQKFINAMLHMPKEYYVGLSFKGVEPYAAHNYSETLSLLNEYHKLNVSNAECKKLTKFDNNVRIWTGHPSKQLE